ncbi:hypothetical protein KAI92_00080 [Candidatus Parcubacteria bacterium]|nr:hypothetical protein [Candidatus Parcubacteria bacterium]
MKYKLLIVVLIYFLFFVRIENTVAGIVEYGPCDEIGNVFSDDGLSFYYKINNKSFLHKNGKEDEINNDEFVTANNSIKEIFNLTIEEDGNYILIDNHKHGPYKKVLFYDYHLDSWAFIYQDFRDNYFIKTKEVEFEKFKPTKIEFLEYLDGWNIKYRKKDEWYLLNINFEIEIEEDDNNEYADDKPNYQINNLNLYNKLKGNILIKPEDKGKAYYINSRLKKIHYLGRPCDAFEVMRSEGVGITNSDLSKIKIGFLSTENQNDLDGDGLSDALEISIGTDITNSDSDNDGFNDKEEILNNFSPIYKNERLKLDSNFANKLKGRILLQVELNGEAWYINPDDEKRYFLGRPSDCFEIMKKIGLGISNNDFGRLAVEEKDETLIVAKKIIKFNLEDFLENNKVVFVKPEIEKPTVSGVIDLYEKYEYRLLEDPFFEIEDYCVSDRELELAKLVNNYRESRGLRRVPVSKSLSYVAKLHTVDQENYFTQTYGHFKYGCSGHSWTKHGAWSGCCVVLSSASSFRCASEKAYKLTDYPGEGYENSYWSSGDWDYNDSPKELLRGWKNSHGHNILMIEAEGWSGYNFQSMGVAITGNYANLWFGQEPDPNREPISCSKDNYTVCDSIKNKSINDDCSVEKILRKK